MEDRSTEKNTGQEEFERRVEEEAEGGGGDNNETESIPGTERESI